MPLSGEALELMAELVHAYNYAVVDAHDAEERRQGVRERILAELKGGSENDVSVDGFRVRVNPTERRSYEPRLLAEFLTADQLEQCTMRRVSLTLTVTPLREGR